MKAIIHKVEPHPKRQERHLDVASDLAPFLDRIDGIVSIERFNGNTIKKAIEP
ncbi:MAG: hypothetical protein O7I42_25645 [Alphaproteobacteria bacterium]|nr:hypothetical protein [Alphaproteobacteria bacterium]